MSSQDVRWKQRFDNFNKAFHRLSQAIDLSELNELERNGLVQRFEFTLELAWNVMKDFLEEQGFEFNPSPKDTFRKAQNAHCVDYAQALIDGLNIRNALSHDYSGEKFMVSESVLRGKYFRPSGLSALSSCFK
jgi:nucleotidyltransferase substrate binding protein (TIGR01987 family)